MKKIILLLGLVLSGTYLCAQEAPDQFPEAGAREENYTMRLTARVVDEEGKPMAGVPIRIGIHNVNDYKDQYNDFRGKTDAEGKFSAEGVGRAEAWIEVKKDGYYVSRKFVTCYEGTAEQIRKTGKYLPWDPVIDVMVKKVGKPIPMIVRLANAGSKSRLKPTGEQIGKKLAWDLILGDWVAPHGKGKVADILVKFESTYVNEQNRTAKVRIEFANVDDGCIPLLDLKGQESLLRFPRKAPTEGYDVKKLDYSLEYKEVEDGFGYKERTLVEYPALPHKGYLLRLRTKTDENGKVVSSVYGKITNPFELEDVLFQGRRRLFLSFDYYLNPTQNDRNLEYDQVNNLAPDSPKGVTWLP